MSAMTNGAAPVSVDGFGCAVQNQDKRQDQDVDSELAEFQSDDESGEVDRVDLTSKQCLGCLGGKTANNVSSTAARPINPPPAGYAIGLKAVSTSFTPYTCEHRSNGRAGKSA